VNLQLHSEALIEQVWRCTLRRSSSQFGDPLAGYDQERMTEYMQAVDWRRAGSWDSIHQLVNPQPWECD